MPKLTKLLSLIIAVGLFVPPSVWAQPGSGPGNSTPPTANSTAGASPVNLDLSSSTKSVTANLTKNVSIFVGSTKQVFQNGQLVTPAEMVALSQVLAGGAQTLQIGASGNAINGRFSIPSSTLQSISSLVVPQSVKLFENFSASNALSISGNFTDAGKVILSSTPGVSQVSINANNIYVQAGGILSSIGSLSMSLNALGNIVNSGTISSAGALSLSAGGSIVNALSAGATGATPTIQAVNNVTLLASNITNSGTIASALNNINISAASAQSIAINAAGGQFQALNGAINVRDASYAGKGDLTMTGGDYLSNSLNLYSGCGAINANIGNVTGSLNGSAGSAHVTTAGNNLDLGNITINGDPTFYNDAGSISITGSVQAMEAIAIIANGSITSTFGGAQVIANDGTNGDNIYLIAGAKVTSATGTASTSVPPGNALGATDTAVVDFTAGNGGNIDFSQSTSVGLIISASATNGGGGNGGNVVLVARANGGTGGRVIFPTNSLSVDTRGDGAGTSGTVTIIAGASSGTAITTGDIETSGGSVSLNTANPVSSDGNTITFAYQGNITSGNTINPGTTTTAAITTGNIGAGTGNITEVAGTSISTNSGFLNTLTGNNLSFTAGTDIGLFETAAHSIAANSAGGNVQLINNGNVILENSSAGNNAIFSLSTVAGNSTIDIQGNVIAQGAGNVIGEIDLSANLAGNITRSTGVGTLTANSINLTSGTGDIGAAGLNTNVFVAAGTLTANTAGNVYVTDQRSVILGASSAGAGDNFDLTTQANGSIDIQANIAAVSGTIGFIQLSANGTGNITRSTGVGTLSAAEVFLESGSGDIGAPAAINNISTFTATTDILTGGNVYVSNTGSVILGLGAAGNGNTFQLSTTNNGSIDIQGDVIAGLGTIGTINLIANGSGNIMRSTSTGVLTANSVNLSSTTGNIGVNAGSPGTTEIAVTTTTLAANTRGNVAIDSIGDVILDNSSAGNGKNFELDADIGSNGSIDIQGNVAASVGTISKIEFISDGSGSITRSTGVGVLTATTVNLYNGFLGPGTGDIGATGASFNIVTNAAHLGLFGGGNVFVTNQGSTILDVGYAGTGDTFNLTTLNNGSIDIQGNVSDFSAGTIATINLIADGSGSITRSTGIGILFADRINLTSTTGDIGGSAAAQHIFVDSHTGAPAISLTANTAGNVYLTLGNLTGTTELGASSAGNGKTFEITGTGALDLLGNVQAATGTIGTININIAGALTNDVAGVTPYDLTANTVNLTASSISQMGASYQFVTAANVTANATGTTSGDEQVYVSDNINAILGNSGTAGDSNAVFFFFTSNNASIDIQGNVSTAHGAPIQLSANGTGAITRSTGVGTLTTTGEVSLFSGSGDIGTSTAANHIFTNAGLVSAITTGNVYLTNTSASVGLLPSEAGNGKTFELTTQSNGSIAIDGTVSALSGTIGTINLTANGSGNITCTTCVTTPITLVATNVNLKSTTGDIGAVTAADNVLITATTLSANTAGNVYVTSTGNIDLIASSAGASKTFDLTAETTGAITDSTGALLTAGFINLASTSGDIGTSTNNMMLGPTTFTGNTSGNVFVTDTGSIVLGPNSTGGSGKKWQVTTQNNGGIDIQGNVLATGGIVNLFANGSGAITRSTGVGTLTGATVVLTSTSGDIGASAAANHIFVNAGMLNTMTSGNTYVNSTGASVIIVGATVGSGDTYELTTSTNGSIDIQGDVKAATGTAATINLNANGSGAITRSTGVGTLVATNVNLTSGTGDIGASTAANNIVVTTTNLTSNTGGNDYLTSTGSVNLLGSSAGDTKTFQLTTQNNGGIDIQGNVIAGTGTIGTINLIANGSGAITNSLGTSVLTATTVNLTSTSGNIGDETGDLPVIVAASNLSANTTGLVEIQSNNSVVLKNSSAGNGETFEITSKSGSDTGIDIQGNVAAAGLGNTILAIVLTADGTGAITRSTNVGVLTATHVGLASGSGDIGSGTNLITIAGGTLRANTAGNVFVNSNGDVTLNTYMGAGSSAGSGKTFEVSAQNSSIDIQANIAAASGTIGSIDLTSVGTGNITRSTGVGVLTASSTTLDCGTGNIGTNTQNIVISGGTLNATTNSGNAFVISQGSVVIGDFNKAIGGIYQLTTQNNGSIDVQNSITATGGTINLTANGSGNITRTTGSGVLTADNVNLLSTSGNIGGSALANQILTAAGTLTAATGGLGNVYLNQTGAVTLGNSMAGGTFQLLSSAATNVNSIFTGAGSITVDNATGTLTVNANSNISSTGGNVTLEDDDTVAGQINVNANAFITAGSTLAGQGNVNVVIGPVPGTPVLGTAPLNVLPTTSQNGKIFWGTHSITAQAPTNTVTAVGKNVIFNTGTLANTHIHLGGGVVINAVNFPLLSSLDLTNAGAVSFIQAEQAAGKIGGRLIVSGGIAVGGNVILTPVNMSGALFAEDIPNGVTVTFNGFHTQNPVNFLLGPLSSTPQVTINGTEQFVGTLAKLSNAVINISSSLGGTVLNIGPTGKLTSDGTLTVNAGGDVLVNGLATAPTITFDTTAGSNGGITVNGALGTKNVTKTTTLFTDGTGSINTLTGTIFGVTMTLGSALGDIGSSLSFLNTNATTLTANTGGNVNISNVASMTLGASSAGAANTLDVQALGTITQTGILSGGTVTLQTVGNNGSLSLGANINAPTGTINLITLGTGTVMQKAGLLNTTNLVLSAIDGAVGTSTAAIKTNASFITANSGSVTGPFGAANIFVADTGAVTLLDSASGGSFNVSSAGNMTVNNVSTQFGTITLTSGATLNVNAGVTIAANGGLMNGNVILNDTNTVSGQINIGASATITATSSATGGGNVSISIGKLPAPQVATNTPANVTPVVLKGGRIFFGTNSITATAPTNTITASGIGHTVTFSTSPRPASAITLGGGDTITAISYDQGQAASAGNESVVDTGDIDDNSDEGGELVSAP